MTKNMKFQLSIAFVCLVLGFMLFVQFKTIKQSVGPVSEYRARELATVVKKLTEEKTALLKIKSDYEAKIGAYENTAANSSSTSKVLKEELDKARILAGLTDVEGPGVTIQIDDGKYAIENNYAIITHEMLLQVINELNAAGAEAISINKQRIISETEIRQAGIWINVNTVKLAPPFTIKAIGDPKQLEAALLLRGGVKDQFTESGVTVGIEKTDKVGVEKFDGIIEHKYALEVEKAGQ